jgi:hypothetical protein
MEDSNPNTPDTQSETVINLNALPAYIRFSMAEPIVTTGPRKIVLSVGGESVLQIEFNQQTGDIHVIRAASKYDTKDALRLTIAECDNMLKWIQETLDGLPTDPNDKRLLEATTNEKYRKIIALTNQGNSPSQIASLTGLERVQINTDKGRIKKIPKLAKLMIEGMKKQK